jgi:Ser/Thr protein kinase RdoA (MazF antagonist)
MSGTLVEPDWPPLAMDEVRSLLGAYPACGEPQKIISASPRPFSAASVVETLHGSVFIKRHHRAVRDKQGLLEEHRFLGWLSAHGDHVPKLLVTSSGETAIEKGDWTYEVQEAADGIDLYRDAHSWTPFRATQHAYSAGQSLARLHLASEGFVAPRRKPQPLVASFTIFAGEDSQAALQTYLSARPVLAANSLVTADVQEALQLLAPFHDELKPLLSSLLPMWTHNDLHASNMLWSDVGNLASPASTIDFGLSDLTNAVHDIAHAIERNIVEWLFLVEDPTHPESVPVHFNHLQALLDGYESIRPLRPEEAAALAPMVALCHAEFALSETDYFLDVLHSPEKAMLACDGWLVGHAHWFHSDAGKRLLDTVRERATRHPQVKSGI